MALQTKAASEMIFDGPVLLWQLGGLAVAVAAEVGVEKWWRVEVGFAPPLPAAVELVTLTVQYHR
jgi:hypothetical protein